MYQATIKKPFEPPTTQESSNLRLLLRELRTIVVKSPPGTYADVEVVEKDERMQVARYENSEGRLKKVM